MNMLYPDVETLDLKPKELPTSTAEYVSRGAAVPDDVIKDPKLMREDENSCGVCDEDNDFVPLIDCSSIQRNNYTPNGFKNANQATNNKKIGRYFFYEEPFDEDTGVWIPVSIPPLSLSDHEEFARGFLTNGAYFPEGELTWSQLAGEDKEMTIWDVMLEILLIARGKVTSLSIGELRSCKLPCIPNELLLEHSWNEMSHTLAEASFVNAKEVLDAEPPKWVADSAAAACMLCNVKFHPIICSRHHCRFCGGLFCNECSKGRCLLPSKFRIWDPQRVCDVCSVRLHFVQPCLMNQVSRASQLPTLDLIDLSTLRSWLNFPWGQSMECEIYKAANIIHDYNKVGYLKPERSIPDAILKQAKGLAIITVAKVGMMVTYNVGTGLVIARRDDGSWSPPSAISTFGIGWGAQAGGELTDFIIVLKTKDALKNFSRNVHISLGAGISAAAGIIGRTAEADLHAGAGGFTACYTYSRSKGAFLGCSLEGGMLTTRTAENCRFYGSSAINASEILLGEIPRPPAAAILYSSLSDLFQKLENRLIR